MNVRVKALDVSVSDVLRTFPPILASVEIHFPLEVLVIKTIFIAAFIHSVDFVQKPFMSPQESTPVANFRDTRTEAQGKLLKALICYWDNKNVRVSNSRWLLNC